MALTVTKCHGKEGGHCVDKIVSFFCVMSSLGVQPHLMYIRSASAAGDGGNSRQRGGY